MKVLARFYCQHVADCFVQKPVPEGSSQLLDVKHGESVSLLAVYSPDPNSPNYVWSEATPSGSLTMYISNPAAWGSFVQGKEYALTIEPVFPAQ